MPPSVIKPGVTIDGRYRLERRIGAGGVGEVWLATQEGLRREVAVKLLHGEISRHGMQRFEREAQALARIQHPNCVMLYDFGQSEEFGCPYLAMEVVEGMSLAERLGDQLPWPEVARIGLEIAEALTAAHDLGIVHRDLKPENVMLLARSGDGAPLVKVLDFGIARIVEDDETRLTATSDVFGTPRYMSPEQIRSTAAAGPASDLYTLGVILYEALEGSTPFDGPSDIHVMQAHLSESPPSLRRHDIPPHLAVLVNQLLRKTPSERPGSASEVAERLRQIMAGDPRGVENGPIAAGESGNAGQLKSVTLGIVGVLGGLGVVLAGLSFSSDEPDAPPVELPPPPPVVEASVPDAPDENVAPVATVADEPDASTEPEPTCSTEPEWRGTRIFGGESYAMHVPRDLDFRDRRALVVALHGSMGNGATLIETSGLKTVAEREGVLLLAPTSRTLPEAWRNPAAAGDLMRLIQKTAEAYCVAPEQVFLLSTQAGSEMANLLACEMPFGAMASHGARKTVGGCPNGAPIPFMTVTGRHDPYMPYQGGERCYDQSPVPAWTTHLAALRKRHRCEDDFTVYERWESGFCQRWQGCSTALATCEFDGGHDWPGVKSTARSWVELFAPATDCSSSPARVDLAELVWAFFDTAIQPGE